MDYSKFEGHTPGPFSIERIFAEDEIMGALTILAIDGSPVAKTNHSIISRNRPTPEIIANAHLFATAPELLEENKRLREALEMMVKNCLSGDETRLLVVAVGTGSTTNELLLRGSRIDSAFEAARAALNEQ